MDTTKQARDLSTHELANVNGGRCEHGTPDNGCDPCTPLESCPSRPSDDFSWHIGILAVKFE